MGEKRRETETTFCITERFSNDKDFIRLPRQDLPGMMKSLKSSYKSRK